jgi:DNA-3-methyladenine glycosylase
MSAPADTPQFCDFGTPLPNGFFERPVLEVAPDLIGRVLVSTAGGEIVAGRIVESEAYLGDRDPGSHAATRRVTARNAVMYGPPGTVYVYFSYGNHNMVNLVCEREGVAGAVLVRALEPLAGIDIMRSRRSHRSLQELCSGPGRLAAALGVDLSDNGSVLGQGRLQVYAGKRPRPGGIATTGRVGLTNGHDLPYRFLEKDNTFVSRGRPGRAPRTRRARPGDGGSSA